MLKYLRIAVTALSLTACVLLKALWVESYSSAGGRHELIGADQVVFYESSDGEVRLLWLDTFMVAVLSDPQPFVVPYWSLVSSFALLAAIPWLPWSKRFTLRTLLIATTLVAVGLGIIISTS